MSLFALPLLLVHICISSAMLHYKRFAEKDFRVPASAVFDTYGIILCAKKCQQSGKCVAINFNPSSLLCELVFAGKKVSYDAVGWLHFKDLSWLQETGISTGKYEHTCGNKTPVRLSSGNIVCIDPVVPMECQDIRKSYVAAGSGVYRIFLSQIPLDVFCDMDISDDGWTVIQARKDGSENFNRTWNEYKAGFGNATGEMWLGNDNLHNLLSKHKYKLRVDLEDFEGNRRYALFNFFSVGSESASYEMRICCYKGTAGNAGSPMNGLKFSTIDRDNDNYSGSCAHFFPGGWWFNDCLNSNLNGIYYDTGRPPYEGIGILWVPWRGKQYSYKAVSMKVRKRN